MTNSDGENERDEDTGTLDAGLPSTGQRRRDRLAELQSDVARARAEAGADSSQEEDPELQAFLQDLAEKKNRRKTQLALVRAFFSDPLRFSAGLNDQPVTGAADIAQRRALIEDQIDLLSTVLEAARTELEQLDKALESPDGTADETTPAPSRDA